ncbi:MAG: PorV/PorQ family protein [Candidatus Zixiibacteriota bacterium]
MRKIIFLSLFLCLTVMITSSISKADVSRSGVLFLRIAAGARAAGMGEAFVAISDDATATHWNPAGLGLYPLTANWLEYPLPPQFALKSIALLRNDVPEMNYKRYDVWAISDLDLFRLHQSIWVNYEEYPTSSGESLESILRKYTQVSDDARIESMKKITAELNQTASKDSLLVLKEKVLAAKGSGQEGDYPTFWDELLSAWDGCLLLPDELTSMVKKINDFLSDDSLTTGERDQLYALFPKVIMKGLPDVVRIPYRLLFTDSLTICASDGKLLWVGSKDGLLSFDGKGWRRYSTEEGLPSPHITAILPISERYVWVGTDQGTIKYDGAKWTQIPFGDGVEDLRIVDFANAGERQIWAATKNQLFRLEGESWQEYERYNMKIGDTLEKVIKRFLGIEEENAIRLAMEKVKTYNALQDTVVAAGSDVKLPFDLVINGEITALALDGHQNLWMGTNHGLKRYTENQWYTFGYKLYTAVEGDDAQKVAQRFLQSNDEENLKRLSQIIIDYNHLGPDGKLEPGQKVYVYYNATGSEILSLANTGGDQMVVGTQYGTIRWDGQTWGRYYHSGLEKSKTKEIIHRDGELWFATGEKVVIYAHARRELTFMHANWLPELATDLYYDYASIVINKEGWGTLGANLTYLSLGKNVRTDEYGAEKGVFDSFEMAFALSYGTKLNSRLSSGISGKMIYSHLADQGAGYEKGKGSGSSFALDAGLLSNLWMQSDNKWTKLIPCLALDAWILTKGWAEREGTKIIKYVPGVGDTTVVEKPKSYHYPGLGILSYFIAKKIDLGIAATNFGPNIAYIDLNQSDPLPRNLAVGLAFRFVDTPFNKLTATFDVNKELVGLDDPMKTEIKEAIENMGIEYWYGTYVALRAGYIYDRAGDIKTPTFGAGLQYGHFHFDFAYIPSSKDLALANTMRFSMTGSF